MTENEAISVLNMIEAHGSLPIKAKKMAIQALEEIQQYRAIGTVEDMAFYKKCYDEESYEYCGEYGTDNCGCKDRIEHLEKKIAEFEEIGTIEEFKALKEKNFFNTDSSVVDVDKKSYDRAIDEFVKKICEKYTEEESKGHYKQYCANIKQYIADIAEQMKVGAE